MKKLFTHLMMTLLASIAFIANAETLSPTEVQAACLDSYNMRHGSWQIVFIDQEDALATISIQTSGYNHIAGSYDLTNTDSSVLNNEVPVTGGSLDIEYVSDGVTQPIYHFSGSFETASTTYTVDITTEVVAYDYLYFLYYDMGYFSYDQILIALDDAPDDSEHTTYELTMTSGVCTDYIASMGALQFTAEDETGYYMQVICDAEELADDTTYPVSEVYTIYCYLADMNTSTYVAYFKGGEVKLNVVADNTVSLEATLIAKGGDVYHVLVPECYAEGVEYNEAIHLSSAEVLRMLASKRMQNGKIIVGDGYDLNGMKMNK